MSKTRPKRDTVVKMGEPFDPIRDRGIKDPDELRVKFDLAYKIAMEVESRGLSQGFVAEMVGLKQPDVSRIVNGVVKDYSVWRLMRVLSALGKDVAIEVVDTDEPVGSIYAVEGSDPGVSD